MNEITSVVRLERIRVSFDSYATFALADLNLDVRRGEILGLIGPKGSGKSTTLGLLAGRLRPSEGKVKVFGCSPRRSAIKARLGYLPEVNSRLKPHGIREFFTRWFNGPHSPTSNLPNDLLLARLLLRRPDLLLLDEPFARLDEPGFLEIIKLIREFAKQGRTVVLTNETLFLAKDICDRMAIFFRGQLQAIGSLDELLATTDAIRVLGPALPRETADRVLQAIRSEMPVNRDGIENSANDLRIGNGGQPRSKSQTPIPQPDTTVDHERLARLTKPELSRQPLPHKMV